MPAASSSSSFRRAVHCRWRASCPAASRMPATATARFSKDRADVHLTLIEPVVVEVLADST